MRTPVSVTMMRPPPKLAGPAPMKSGSAAPAACAPSSRFAQLEPVPSPGCSTTVGLALVPVRVGASFAGFTVVPSV